MSREAGRWGAVLLAHAAGLCLAAAAPAAPLGDAQKQDLYIEAKRLFHQADEAASKDPAAAKQLYRDAAMRFERLARDGGIHNGKLYYNIGNAYFRMGDLGRAILNYRKAQRYIPGDPNLIQNLQYARTRRRDQLEERQQTRVLKTILFWHYDLSPQARSAIFAFCFAAFWCAASVRLFWKKAAPRWLLACLAAAAALFFASLLAESIAYARARPGVVLADEVVARKGDGVSYEPAFKEPLHAGTEFTVVEQRRQWLQAELPDGRRCWLPADAVDLQGDEPASG